MNQPTPDAPLAHAIAALKGADGLLITAGAGMGVDSGLPDFRGNTGLWAAYPALRRARLDFTRIANPAAFLANPRLAWGFYGHTQIRFEDRADHQQHRHLHHSVPDARDAERPFSTIGFGHPHAQQGPRVVRLPGEFLPQSFQPRASPVVLNVLESFAIESRRPAIGAAAPVGLLENVLATHLVPRAVETGSRFVLGFRLQCGL